MNSVPSLHLEESGSADKRPSNKRKKDSHELHRTRNLPRSQYLPWKQNPDYSSGIIGLHEEILDFVNFISPTPKEQYIRETLVKKIKDVILELWPHTKFDVFGSFGTGLYLPKSDIDIVINGDWHGSPLYTLEKALLDKDIPETITVLDKATVPIVRLTDKTTKIRVDISYNMRNGVPSVKLIKDYLNRYPCLKPLVLVLKEFLLERDLNEVWTGGISSYSLILMCVHFLQHSREEVLHPNRSNLAVLLLEFFYYYGVRFNYNAVAIQIHSGGKLVPKSALTRLNGARNSILCIEDPLDPSNDIGRSSYGVLQVRRAFEHAYQILFLSVLPSYIPCPSPLSFILSIPKSTLEYRSWIANEIDINMECLSSDDDNQADVSTTFSSEECEEESLSTKIARQTSSENVSSKQQSNSNRPTYAHVLRSGSRDNNFNESHSVQKRILSDSQSQDDDTDSSEFSTSAKAVLKAVSSSGSITDISIADDSSDIGCDSSMSDKEEV